MGWIEGRAPASDGAIAAAKMASSPPKRERRESIFVDPFGRASAIKEMLGTAASIIFGAPSTRTEMSSTSTPRRSARAAHRFFRKLLTDLQYGSAVIVTDKLKRYAAAKRKILPGVEYRQALSSLRFGNQERLYPGQRS